MTLVSLLPAEVTLELVPGDDVALAITIKENGVAVDVSARVYTVVLTDDEDDVTPVFTFTVDMASAVNGIIVPRATGAQMTLAPDLYWWKVDQAIGALHRDLIAGPVRITRRPRGRGLASGSSITVDLTAGLTLDSTIVAATIALGRRNLGVVGAASDLELAPGGRTHFDITLTQHWIGTPTGLVAGYVSEGVLRFTQDGVGGWNVIVLGATTPNQQPLVIGTAAGQQSMVALLSTDGVNKSAFVMAPALGLPPQAH